MSRLETRKYTIEDLKDKSTLSRILSMTPAVTSPFRLRSYLQNPRARDEDKVLYVLIKEGRIVAYRSLLSDDLYLEDKNLHIAWFSGNYVVPEERRKGYSSQLLAEVEKDWGDRLFFSNFAWPSKYVLDQEGGYTTFQVLEGKRYYFRFGLAELLPPKSIWFQKMKGALFQADRVLNSLYTPFSRSVAEVAEWERVYYPEDKDFHFIEKFHDKELFKRGKEEFEWILKYPWVSTSAEAKEWSQKYHFSVYASDFDLSFYRLRQENETHGLIMVSIKEGVMHVPYCYLKEDFYLPAVQLLLRLASQHQVLHLTVYNDVLTIGLDKFSGYFLFSKKFEQAFLCNSDLLDQYPQIQRKQIHKGDGDAVFT